MPAAVLNRSTCGGRGGGMCALQTRVLTRHFDAVCSIYEQCSAIDARSHSKWCTAGWDATRSEILRDLRVTSSYEASSGTRASYEYSAMSLPDEHNRPTQLDELCWLAREDSVEASLCKQVVPDEASERRLPARGASEVFHGPRLLHGHERPRFVRRLRFSNFVDCSLHTPRELKGCFSVVKKGKSIVRLVVDGRRSNMWFSEPRCQFRHCSSWC